MSKIMIIILLHTETCCAQPEDYNVWWRSRTTFLRQGTIGHDFLFAKEAIIVNKVSQKTGRTAKKALRRLILTIAKYLTYPPLTVSFIRLAAQDLLVFDVARCYDCEHCLTITVTRIFENIAVHENNVQWKNRLCIQCKRWFKQNQYWFFFVAKQDYTSIITRKLLVYIRKCTEYSLKNQCLSFIMYMSTTSL